MPEIKDTNVMGGSGLGSFIDMANAAAVELNFPWLLDANGRVRMRKGLHENAERTRSEMKDVLQPAHGAAENTAVASLQETADRTTCPGSGRHHAAFVLSGSP